MQRAGHIGAALAATAPIVFVTAALGFEDLAFLGALVAVGLAMLPDIDLRIPLVPHRGPTHTVWFTLLVAAVGGYLGWTAGTESALGAGLAVFGAVVAGTAVGSHVVADALTPMGVRPYAPVSDRHVTFAVTRASNPVANLLVLVAGIGLAIGAFVLGGWISAS